MAGPLLTARSALAGAENSAGVAGRAKRPPLGRTALVPPESARSADVRDPFLRLRLGGGSWLSGKLKHCCSLTFIQVRQKLNVPVGKFQRVVVCVRLVFVNLPKDGRGVLDCFHFPAKHANSHAL